MDSVALGWCLWACMFTIAWLNKRRHDRGAWVSRNTHAVHDRAVHNRVRTGARTAEKWEQIRPFDECFEEDDW